MPRIIEPTWIAEDLVEEQLLDLAAVKRALTTRVMGSRLVYRESTTSTMEDAREEARRGAPEGTIALAEEQTAGRGRFGRAWVSPPGQNLHFSVVLRPEPWSLRCLNMAAALAVARAVRDVAMLPTTTKWPNDVLIHGRKVSGILVEASWQGKALEHAILGIGVNVNLDPSRYAELATIATSIAQAVGHPISREEVLIAIVQQLDALYVGLKKGQSPLEPWTAELETLGHRVRVTWADELMEGYAEGVDAEGNLVLRLDDGTRKTIAAGEVTVETQAREKGD